MFEKNMRLAYLLDFYGDALDEHTKNIMTAYYEDDLSLAEIAEDEKISRQGVRHIIKKGEEQLEFLESRLGLAEHHITLKSAASKLVDIQNALNEADADKFKSIVQTIDEVVNTILNK